MTSEDDFSWQRQFRYLEWTAIAFTACAQLCWCRAVVDFDQLVAVSFLLLTVSCIASIFTPRATAWRFLQLVCQVLLISGAGALGAHHLYYLNLYVFAAKAALLLPRPQMLGLTAILLICHVISGQFALYALHQMHLVHHPVPRYYTTLVVEIQGNLCFFIGLITVAYLGRTLVRERKNRIDERSLGNEVNRLAIRSERARIARNIHDGLGHTLNSLKIQLELALKLLEERKPGEARDLLIRCREAAGSSLNEVRRAVTMQQNFDFDLLQEITELVNQIKQQGALTFTLRIDEISLASTVQNHIFKMVQECLTNVRKHSSASHVEIALKKQDGQITLSILDNGTGFDANKKRSGFGLKGLRERAKIIGATISIQSEIGKGTNVFIFFPKATALLEEQSADRQNE